MSQAELPVLRVAYMPLIDCAPLVAASRLGLDHAYGLQLQLHRQASWAGVRDRLLAGEVDAAHTLASLVYAIDLGVGGPQCPMALLMTLNHNGQAITLAPALAQGVAAGQPLPQVLAEAGRRVVFAQTFPTGTHALWLYYWLAACGVDPMRTGASTACSIRRPPERAAGPRRTQLVHRRTKAGHWLRSGSWSRWHGVYCEAAEIPTFQVLARGDCEVKKLAR